MPNRAAHAIVPVVVALALTAAAPAGAQSYGTHSHVGDQPNNTGVQLNSSSDDNTVANANAQGGAGGAGGVGLGGAGGTASALGGTGGTVTGGSVEGANLSAAGNSVSVEARDREAASAIAAPPAVYGTDSCLSPWGAAGQATVFGLSLGGVQEDATCRRIKLAREYDRMGWSVAAASMHCLNGPEAVTAMRAEGIDCRELTGGNVTQAQYDGAGGIDHDTCFQNWDNSMMYMELRNRGLCP